MIKSMTGFGRSSYEVDGRNYTVEIKSVNHKYSDVSVKIPKTLVEMEDGVRKKVASSISRGKVDVYISFENYSTRGTEIKINNDLAKDYVENLKKLAEVTGVEYKVDVIDVVRMPDILKLKEADGDETIAEELDVAVDGAIKKFIEMREVEGEKLVLDIKNRLDYIDTKVKEITKFSSTLVTDYMEKLEARIKELMKTSVVDETRLAQEIVIFSDKSSIEEELTRLNSHISQFNKLLKEDSPIGKKLDFLVQEMNREINTIGSKANCLDITNRVIDVKTEIENIREQIQNIE